MLPFHGNFSRAGIEPATWGGLMISSSLLQSPALPTELSGVFQIARSYLEYERFLPALFLVVLAPPLEKGE